MSEEGLRSWKTWDRDQVHAPPILLEKAAFLLHLGQARAALVLYDWACDCAPADPDAIEGQMRARQIAVDEETTRYWRKIVGSRLAA